jgi:ferritin-like metal-binding protein YciE
MRLFSANLDDLRKLYVRQIRMLLSMEQQIVAALPKMIGHATDTQVKQALQSHLQETKIQAVRLERILHTEADDTETVNCGVMEALASEAEAMAKNATDESVRDAALIAAAQRVEHYEIACYGAVRRWAQLLGKREDAELLDKTIHEEGHADHLLTEVADRVNVEAEKAA